MENFGQLGKENIRNDQCHAQFTKLRQFFFAQKFHFTHINEITYHAQIFHASRTNFSPNQASCTNISTPSTFVTKTGLNREEKLYWQGGSEITRDRLRGIWVGVLFPSFRPLSLHWFAPSRLLMIFTRKNNACSANQVFCMMVLFVKRSEMWWEPK